MWNVWTTTQVDERPTSIYRSVAAIGNLILYDVLLVFITFKHFQQIIFRQDQSLEWLFLLYYLISDGLQWLPV